MRSGLVAVGLAAAAAAHAQVIEIDPQGAARTYEGPTQFVGGVAQPIAQVRAADAFDAAAAESGLDRRLIEAVVWRESRGQAQAVSPKGALGLMQLMPATAAGLGVDPRDPEANLRGGARYLRAMVDRFGDWSQALAAYNAGPGAVERHGGVPPYAETRAYVRAVLERWAAKRGADR